MDAVVMVSGNVGSAPELRQTADGLAVLKFRLATSARRRDKETDTWSDGPTSWYRVTCWRQLADNVAASVHKGDPVVVRGRLQVREFTRGDGSPGTAVEIIADTVGHDLGRGRAEFSRAPRGERAAGPVAAPPTGSAAA